MASTPESAGLESARLKPRQRSRRLPLLLGLLAAMGAGYFATASSRQQALTKAELIRRQVDQAEEKAKEEIQARQKRHERVQLLNELSQKPTDTQLLLRVGALYAQDRRYEDALFLLHEARRLKPDDLEPYRALYQAYVSQGQFDRAYDYAAEGLKRGPGDLELVLGLVHIDSLVGWNAQARQKLRSLPAEAASNPRALVASALIYRQVTDARHAEADLKAALRQEPKNDKMHALLSGVQWEIGRGKEAEEAIRKALELAPNNADYLLHLAEIQLRRRTPEGIAQSRQTAEAALRADPGNRNAFFALAQTFLAEKKTGEAEEILRKLLERYPDHPHASFELAKIYMQSGRTEEGKRLMASYQEGIRLADELKSLTLKVAMVSDSADHHADLGELYNRTGSSDKGVLVLRKALKLQPNHAKAKRELARALANTGRSGEYAELVRNPGWHVVDPLSAEL